MSIHWEEVAERIRGVVRATTADEMREAAARLGVSETMLQASIDGRSRLSAIKVIAALAARSGVDANWMITGKIDSVSHRRMLERSIDEIETMVKARVAEASRENDGEGGRDSRPGSEL